MAALTASRATRRRGLSSLALVGGIATATTLYQGGIICRNAAGYLVPGATSTTLVALGVLTETISGGSVTNAGANGVIKQKLEAGIFGPFVNSAAADQITIADVGNVCFMVDDQTLARTNGTNTRSVAGVVYDVDSEGVWVEISPLGRKA